MHGLLLISGCTCIIAMVDICIKFPTLTIITTLCMLTGNPNFPLLFSACDFVYLGWLIALTCKKTLRLKLLKYTKFGNFKICKLNNYTKFRMLFPAVLMIQEFV